MSIVRVALLGWLLFLVAPQTHAGTMSVRWSPVTGAAGYRVYWGNAARQYTGTTSVTGTSATLTVADGTTWYVGVKAYSASGLESSTYSNEVAGLARPTVTAVTPTHGAIGQRLVVNVQGTNFQSGMGVEFLSPGIVVNSVSVSSSTSCSADITLVGPAATGIGVRAVRSDRVYGETSGLFTIDAAPNTTAPVVSGVRPASGGLGIQTTMTGMVKFSELMSPASITASTLRILNDAGTVVAQAAGYPYLGLDGVSAYLKPASPLLPGKTYRIQVAGGTGGVKDAGGMAMASTWTQSPGFTTALLDATAPQISWASPPGGVTGVSTIIQPSVSFSEPLLPSSVLPTSVRVLNSTGGVVPQAAGYPVLSADGMKATLKFASPLPAGATFKIQVQGGSTYGIRDLAGNILAVDWNQSQQWTTGSSTSSMDLEGPIVSDVGATTVGSTTVELGWATDELATAQVLYRPENDTEYLESDLAESPVRDHRLTVTGLLPDTRYDFLVRSRDRAGNLSVSSPDQRVATKGNKSQYVMLEAEAGELTGALATGSGDGSSHGRWIELEEGTRAGSLEPRGTARYSVTLPEDGSWYLCVRVQGDAEGNAWFAAIDGSAWSPLPSAARPGWTWTRIAAGKLGPGEHVLDLGALVPGVRIDQVVLTDDPTFGLAERVSGPTGRRGRERREGGHTR